MIRIAVCDDEKEVLEYLTRRIRDILAADDLDGSVDAFSDGAPLAEAYAQGKKDFISKLEIAL